MANKTYYLGILLIGLLHIFEWYKWIHYFNLYLSPHNPNVTTEPVIISEYLLVTLTLSAIIGLIFFVKHKINLRIKYGLLIGTTSQSPFLLFEILTRNKFSESILNTYPFILWVYGLLWIFLPLLTAYFTAKYLIFKKR